MQLENPIDIQWIFFDQELQMADPHFSYYEYSGSLTVPNCDEHTTWYIVEKPFQIGTTQLQMFKDSLQTDLVN